MKTASKLISTSVTALALAIAMGVAASGPVQAGKATKMPMQMTKNTAPAMAINLETNRISRAALKSKIRRAAAAQGIKLTPRQMNQAATSAMGKFANAGNGPQKGKIHVRLGRFDICIAWGKDKGSCGS